MAPFAPRSKLSTHEVSNQPAPLVDVNLYDADALLRGCIEPSAASTHTGRLSELGERVGCEEVQHWADQANRTPPQLHAFDRYGQRIDEVEFHPAYHALMRLGIEAGVASIAWSGAPYGHVAHAALLFLISQADAGVGCPMSMTYAAVPALRTTPELAQTWVPRLLGGHYDERVLPAPHKTGCTFGMAMTEKQGGSDIRANRTVAIAQADGTYSLTGHKWFCSAPMSDAFLTLAKVDGDDAALTCFLAPRWFERDGSWHRNAIELQRLKDKLGDRSNASSEIEYRGAVAHRVGEVGQGVRTIIEMVHHTRLDCIVSAAAISRGALSQAIWHAERRTVFGQWLIDQPLARAVLADLTLEVAGATALAMYVARLFDLASANPEARLLARIATPIAKYWVCKRCPTIVAEAMECLGGAGYIEESPMPRLYRQAPLNGIWEGSGNVIALDVLRSLARDPATGEALINEVASVFARDSLATSSLAARLSNAKEGEARAVVEHAAGLLTAVALARIGLDESAHTYVATRIGQDRALTFGAAHLNIEQQSRLINLGRLG